MPGPLYDGKADLSLRRWHFWRDAFRQVAFAGQEKKGEKEEEKKGDQTFHQECQRVAMKVADMMDSMELNMTCQSC